MDDDEPARKETPQEIADALKQRGATADEVAARLEISYGEATQLLRGEMPAGRLWRLIEVAYSRACGQGDLAAHAQLVQFMMQNLIPAQFGRQQQLERAVQVHVIVDRDGSKRRAAAAAAALRDATAIVEEDAAIVEGEVLPSLTQEK